MNPILMKRVTLSIFVTFLSIVCRKSHWVSDSTAT